MSNTSQTPIHAASAADICSRFYLPKDARQLLRPDMTAREFLYALVAKKRYCDAVDFLAHALAPRDAVWWGCLCLQYACGDSLSPAHKDAAAAAVRWVLRPCEQNRAAAKSPSEAAGAASPAGALAAAVYQSAGSISPPNAPPIPPSPYAPAQAVARAVKLASTKGEPTGMAARQRSFVELGIGVVQGRFLWETLTRAA